jgi:hypothetical protein
MDLIYEILTADDGSFDILKNGSVLHERIPDRWLEDQLGQYGLCGIEYDDIRCQLIAHGRAKIVIAGLPGKPFTG